MTPAIHADAAKSRVRHKNLADRSVTEIYAEIGVCKSLCASSTDSRRDDEYLAAGKQAQDLLIETPAKSLDEVILKFTEALEWMAEEISPSARKLQSEAIRDLKRLASKYPDVDPPAEAAPQVSDEPTSGPAWLDKRLAEAEKNAARSAPAAPTVKVGRPRCCRPTIVDGVRYESIAAAARATGISYAELRKSL